MAADPTIRFDQLANGLLVPNLKVDCLNAGYVRLVDYMGTDDSPIRSARVSYDGDDKTGADPALDARLRRYLLKNRHTSPFEFVDVVFEVKAPIFVFRQWHRHRTWSYNEVSARYTELDMGFYVPEIEQITTQATDNKQGRTTEVNQMAELIRTRIDEACESAFADYLLLLRDGCPRELARAVLPVAAYSRMYAKTDLHNLMGFLKLRNDDHAQYEIRVYAAAMERIVSALFPDTMAAWHELGRP